MYFNNNNEDNVIKINNIKVFAVLLSTLNIFINKSRITSPTKQTKPPITKA